ncbi:MAG: HAMP domain-containing sensor histidine kinase [Bdellovibrionota bacterium]|nr:HAMP domain-containing sensor histidine kinase [Bdellovibrionota bacterium]
MIKLRFLYILILTFALGVNLLFTVFFLKSTIEDNFYLEKKRSSETLVDANFNEITQGNFRDFISSSERSLKTQGLKEVTVFDKNKRSVLASNTLKPSSQCLSSKESFCLRVNSFTEVLFRFHHPSFLSLFSTPLIIRIFLQYTLVIILIVVISSWILKVFAGRLIDFVGRVLLDEDAPEIEEDYKSLKDPVLTIKNKVKTLESENSQYVAKVAKTEVARKLAHDIKSPLATLKGLLSSDSQIDREVLTSIAQRIEGIASDLLDSSREEQAQCLDVALELESLLKEKEIEHQRKIILNLEENFSLYCLKSQFDRSLSNLLNNAIEFSEDDIFVTLKKNEISISDHGVGIAPDVLSEILIRPKSYNKEKGNGIGLVGSKEFVESLGGKLKIESEIGKGTTVSLEFNHASEIIHIDDDNLVRFTWNKKCKDKGLRYHGFSSYDSFKDQFNKNQDFVSKDIHIYVDYELEQDRENGLEVLKQLKEAGFENLFLSTGHEAREFERPDYILAIIGKEFPL